ncbi:serine protease, partial [Streptomyces sp. NPDC005728]|uniref:S1 family peptidase n=1 Tax=Streptomyces sp. NPDC005728 TaxID=3157054 RepID=UPI0033F09C18
MDTRTHRQRRRGRPLLITLLVICLAGGAATAALAITGGQQASDEYSFMASLQRTDLNGFHICGGALIDSTTVVTARHCVKGTSADQLKVRVGSNSVSDGGELVPVADSIPFDDSDDTTVNDISLLKLAEPVEATPVRIADTSPPPGTPVRLLGWGQTCADASCGLTDDLKELDTAVLPPWNCDYYHPSDSSTELCMDATETDAICPGDSGGPALFEDGGELVLAGVASKMAGPCGMSDVLYADVSAFRDWIDANSGDTSTGGSTQEASDDQATTPGNKPSDEPSDGSSSHDVDRNDPPSFDPGPFDPNFGPPPGPFDPNFGPPPGPFDPNFGP